ncbi:MAG TPA: hypothetical protein VII98_07795, partial [Solirubrobacteraceae bacterium]
QRRALERMLRRFFDQGIVDVAFDAPPTESEVRIGLAEIAHGLEGLTAIALAASIGAAAKASRHCR